MASTDTDLCTCSHEHRAHEHYRKGTDCGLCPCVAFIASGQTSDNDTQPTQPTPLRLVEPTRER